MKLGRDHGFRSHLVIWLLAGAIPLAGALSTFAYWTQSGRDLESAERVTRSVSELISKEAIAIHLGRENLVYVEDELVRLVETLPISYAYVTNTYGKIVGTSHSSNLGTEVPCCYVWEPFWNERQSGDSRAIEFRAKSTHILSKNKQISAGERLTLFQFPLMEHSSAARIGTLFVVLPKDQILQASRASAIWLAFCLFVILAVASGLAATFFSKKMSAPIEAMTRAIRESALDPVAAQSTLERVKSLKQSTSIREINTLRQSLVQLHETILTQQKTLEESRLAHLLAGLAAQMGHDIRRPLAVLHDFQDCMEQSIPKEIFSQVKDAIARVQSIADSLLRPVKPGSIATILQSVPLWTSPVPTPIKGPIDVIVSEKKSAYAKRTSIQINSRWRGDADQAWVCIDENALQRSLSNLIDNAVEAISGTGCITIEVSKHQEQVKIIVSDTGRGIPADLLPRLGKPGESHGNPNGVGLGLFGAKSAVESWGGTFLIESTLGQGTSIQILLPEVAQAQEDAVPHDPSATYRMAADAPGPCLVLIEDDPALRKLWVCKAKEIHLSMIAVASFEEWEIQASSLPRDTPIFVDYLLAGGVSGVEVTAKIHAQGFSHLYITTGKARGEFYTPEYIIEVIGKRFPKALFVVEQPSA